jgi:hypothetical protein
MKLGFSMKLKHLSPIQYSFIHILDKILYTWKDWQDTMLIKVN